MSSVKTVRSEIWRHQVAFGFLVFVASSQFCEFLLTCRSRRRGCIAENPFLANYRAQRIIGIKEQAQPHSRNFVAVSLHGVFHTRCEGIIME